MWNLARLVSLGEYSGIDENANEHLSWTFGPDWPNSGEIDIIEGVNSQNANKAALHTSAGCTISNTGAFNGQIMTPNCDVNAPGQYTNAGCQISSYDSATYGQGFNANGGGVYATEWTSDAISIFFFPRGAIPRDLSNGNPNPTGWGKPMARFEGGCNFDQKFQNHNIIFDVTFCGDWAGNVWGQDSVCSSRAPSCQAYVQNNPGAFTDAFWQVNSLKVYSSNGQAVNKAIAVDSDESSAMASPEPVSSAASVGTETSTSVAIQMSTSLLSETSTSLSTETSTSLPTETSISLPSETSTISSLAAQVANTALPTTTPAPTTLATATQRRNRHKTVSPLQWSHFGGSSKGRPAYAKEKRSEHAGHLLQHRHKAHA